MSAIHSFPSRLRNRRWLAIAGLATALMVGGCESRNPVFAAREAADKGDYKRATIELKSALQTHSDSVEMRVMLADLLERQQDLPGAEQHLRRALEANGNANVLTPRIALIMLDRNDAQGIVQAYKDVHLTDAAAESMLRGVVAQAYLSQRRPEAAKEQLEGTGDSPAVRVAQAQMLLAQKKPNEALRALDLEGEKAARAPWWVLRAAKRVAVLAGEPAAGLEYIRRAHEAVPWHVGVLGEYGEALVSASRFEEAARVRDELRKSAPGGFSSFYLDALLQSRAGHVEQAYAAALNALRLSPEDVPAGLLAASAELQRGDAAMAEQRLMAIAQKSGDSLSLLQLLAQAQTLRGNAAAAAQSVRRGLSIAAGDRLLLTLKADMEQRAGQLKRAATTLALLMQMNPDDPELLLPSARVSFRLGNPAGAARLLDRGAALAAGNAVLMGRLVASALEMNDTAMAQRFAELAIAKQPDEPQARLSLAAVQSARNDRASAWATTLGVLDKTPANANALTALSAMSRTTQQRRELKSRYAAAIGTGKAGASVYRDYAALLRFESDPKTTPLAVLDAGSLLLPGSIPLREALVDEVLRTGDAERALQVAQTGANAANAAPEAYALLAATYERLGNAVQAAEAYRKAATYLPQRTDLRLKLTQSEIAANRTAEAISVLRALISERPLDLPGYVALVRLQATTNLLDALSVARQWGDRPGNKAAGLLLAGEAYEIAGKTDDALGRYAQAAEAGAVPDAMLRAARLLYGVGRHSAADQQMAEAVARFPDDARVIEAVSQRALAVGDAARAASQLQRLVARAPNNPVLLNDLAWAQLQSGNHDALNNARKAASALPNNPNVLHTLGLALAKAGKRDEAITQLQASANLAPATPLPHLDLAELLVLAGNRPAAGKALHGIDSSRLSDRDQAKLSRLKTAIGVS